MSKKSFYNSHKNILDERTFYYESFTNYTKNIYFSAKMIPNPINFFLETDVTNT